MYDGQLHQENGVGRIGIGVEWFKGKKCTVMAKRDNEARFRTSFMGSVI